MFGARRRARGPIYTMHIPTFVKRSHSLASLSLVEYGTPFLRMIALSRILPLGELGFTSVLSATYASFILLTDFGAHRFVLSVPREDYEDALASTHALTFLRGLVVGVLGIALAPIIASSLGQSADWESFALVGAIFFIGGFEHYGPRVDERNYRYGVQLQVSLIANGLGLVALLLTLAFARNHLAIVASMFAQVTGQVAASRLLADTPYRMSFRSQYFGRAFRFGYPLMINGLGLAAATQGDRFIVGSLLGLSALGVYSVSTLVTLVPMNMGFRFFGTFMLAALYNGAHRNDGSYAARVRLAAWLAPLGGAIYALGIVTLLNIAMPLVFGRQFTLSTSSVALLALVAFFRIARQDPFTSMLLHQGRTRPLAITNLMSSSALLFEVMLITAFGTFESIIAGKLLGEITAFAVVIYLTRVDLRGALRDLVRGMAVSATIVMIVIGLSYVTPVSEKLIPSLAALAACVAVLVLYGSRVLGPLYSAAGFLRSKPSAPAQSGAPGAERESTHL